MSEEYTTDEIVARYIELRNDKAVMEAKHTEELKPIKESMKVIEQYLGTLLHNSGEESKKTKSGTVYLSYIMTVVTEDKESFFEYAMENDKGMLDVRPSKSGIKEYLEMHPDETIIIPGIKLGQIVNVNVRKK